MKRRKNSPRRCTECATIFSIGLAGGKWSSIHIATFEGDSRVEWFEGNFQDYEKDKMGRLGTDSIVPQQVKYKKFSR